MKSIIFLACLTIISFTATSKPIHQPVDQLVGTWKFSSQSKTNDFQKIFTNKANYQTEFFTFESNHKFTHEFMDNKGNSVKTLKGKWKLTDDKIRIAYSDIDYVLITEYFYIGKDLVLGKNFSHIVFTKENVDFQNMASK